MQSLTSWFLADSWKFLDIWSYRGGAIPRETLIKQIQNATNNAKTSVAGCCWLLLPGSQAAWQPGSLAAWQPVSLTAWQPGSQAA